VAGQIQGGLAAGIGQALSEEIRYDDRGNPLTTSFAEYGILSAADRFIHAYEGNAVVESSLVPQWRQRIAAAFAFPPRAG